MAVGPRGQRARGPKGPDTTIESDSSTQYPLQAHVGVSVFAVYIYIWKQTRDNQLTMSGEIEIENTKISFGFHKRKK